MEPTLAAFIGRLIVGAFVAYYIYDYIDYRNLSATKRLLLIAAMVLGINITWALVAALMTLLLGF